MAGYPKSAGMEEPAAQPPPPPLREIAADREVALFLDFDGTLVEIAERPGDIAVPQSLGIRLARLSEGLNGRLALVSGRAIEDLERHCGPLSVACAGSHGAALRSAEGAALHQSRPLPPAVLAEIADWARHNGADHEAKPHGAALHSRARPELEESCALFLEGLARRHGLAVKRGKKVAELVRPGADKGKAVRRFMAAPPFAGAVPIFVGDDVTDEDGFAACAQLGGFGIIVGERRSARARFALATPADVIEWIEL